MTQMGWRTCLEPQIHVDLSNVWKGRELNQGVLTMFHCSKVFNPYISSYGMLQFVENNVKIYITSFILLQK